MRLAKPLAIAIAAAAALALPAGAAAKKNPLVNADAIVLRRKDDRVYLAGNNDRAHAFAVSKLLEDWGCRWYLPSDFGEVVPEKRDPRGNFRFFENRQKYLLFVHTCSEKRVVAARVALEFSAIHPRPPALRLAGRPSRQGGA